MGQDLSGAQFGAVEGDFINTTSERVAERLGVIVRANGQSRGTIDGFCWIMVVGIWLIAARSRRAGDGQLPVNIHRQGRGGTIPDGYDMLPFTQAIRHTAGDLNTDAASFAAVHPEIPANIALTVAGIGVIGIALEIDPTLAVNAGVGIPVVDWSRAIKAIGDLIAGGVEPGFERKGIGSVRVDGSIPWNGGEGGGVEIGRRVMAAHDGTGDKVGVDIGGVAGGTEATQIDVHTRAAGRVVEAIVGEWSVIENGGRIIGHGASASE